MCRAFFLAIGFFVDDARDGMYGRGESQFEDGGIPAGADFTVRYGSEGGTAKAARTAPLEPPWSRPAALAVTCLYSFTIPRRVAGN